MATASESEKNETFVDKDETESTQQAGHRLDLHT